METPKNPHKHVSLFEKSYLLSISGWLYIHTIQLFETCRRSRIGFENNDEIGQKKLDSKIFSPRQDVHRKKNSWWDVHVIHEYDLKALGVQFEVEYMGMARVK